jgi:menaquinone-dependent protoporphyrinogen IX oxidase
MRALVVYESMYGNTHEIAGNIADGLRSNYEVTLVPVAEATTDLVAAADLLVAGAPTHMHGLPTVATRRMAARASAKGADDPGLPEWLNDLGHRDGLAAAFDTRIKGVPVITGRASHAIARLLKRHGYRLVAAPESFLVSWETTLLDGEADQARRWGMTLGTASKAYLPAHA